MSGKRWEDNTRALEENLNNIANMSKEMKEGFIMLRELHTQQKRLMIVKKSHIDPKFSSATNEL